MATQSLRTNWCANLSTPVGAPQRGAPHWRRPRPDAVMRPPTVADLAGRPVEPARPAPRPVSPLSDKVAERRRIAAQLDAARQAVQVRRILAERQQRPQPAPAPVVPSIDRDIAATTARIAALERKLGRR